MITKKGLPLFDVPSGMGGTFTVFEVSRYADNVSLRVHTPRNPDWHHYTFTAKTEWFDSVKKSTGMVS